MHWMTTVIFLFLQFCSIHPWPWGKAKAHWKLTFKNKLWFWYFHFYDNYEVVYTLQRYDHNFFTGSADRAINLAITFQYTRYPSRTSGWFGKNYKGAECKSAGKLLASYDITEAVVNLVALLKMICLCIMLHHQLLISWLVTYASMCDLQPVYTKRVCAYHKLGSMSTSTFISKLHVHFCCAD